MDRPLYNPETEVNNVDLNESKDIDLNKKINSEEQIPMELDSFKTKFFQFINTFKSKINKRKKYLELSLLWKSPAIPFAIVSFLFLCFIVFVGGVLTYNYLPERINIIYDGINNSWILFDKIFIFLFSIFYFGAFIILTRIVILISRKDKNLATSIAWFMCYLNVLLIITISQIYKLVS